jgi:hypothetical protein
MSSMTSAQAEHQLTALADQFARWRQQRTRHGRREHDAHRGTRLLALVRDCSRNCASAHLPHHQAP